MIVQYVFLALTLTTLASCYQPQRECSNFKDGTFRFTTMINGEPQTSTFIRKGKMEIDFFEGNRDTASVRWINDCEYILQKIHPQNRGEEQAIHMKILSTTDKSYTFEYSIVGNSKKLRGTATQVPSNSTGVDNTN